MYMYVCMDACMCVCILKVLTDFQNIQDTPTYITSLVAELDFQITLYDFEAVRNSDIDCRLL